MISMSRKAGKLILGFDSVKQAIEQEKIQSVFITSDISARTEKEINFVANKYNIIPTKVPVNMEEMYFYISKKVGVFSISDQGLVGAVNKCIETVLNEEKCK